MFISAEMLSALVSFIITVLILSYLIGDNPLFRAAVYIFVGVSAGYVAAVAWNQVILPQVIQPVVIGTAFSSTKQAIIIAGSLVGGFLLLAKAFPRLSGFGQLPMAYLVGVGAAVTVGGAVLGTLLPQINATFLGFDVDLAISRGIRPGFHDHQWHLDLGRRDWNAGLLSLWSPSKSERLGETKLSG